MIRSTISLGPVALAVLLAGAGSAAAYPVAPSLGLDELAGQADLVCKAVAVSSKPVDDAWFGSVAGFQAVETRLKIVAVYKGKGEPREIAFRHYAVDDKGQGYHYAPQHYRLEPGRTYIILAAATDQEGVFRQLWKNYRLQEDQGVLLAADNQPHTGQSIKEPTGANSADCSRASRRPT